MNIRADRKPTIRDYAVILTRLERVGIWTVPEAIRERGKMHRLLFSRKPKRSA